MKKIGILKICNTIFKINIVPRRSLSSINSVYSKCYTEDITPRCRPSFIQRRTFYSKKFSRNIEFFTSSPAPLPTARKDFQVAKHLGDGDRPLALVYSWIMAKDKHVRKYAKLYTDQGIDVLKVRSSPFDCLRPQKGTQVVADDVLKFLHKNPSYSSIVVHGFSAGAYAFSEAMVKIDQNRDKHGDLLRRFVGQIYDSGADVFAIPVGFARAITDNQMLQNSITRYLEWYLKSHYEVATRHYMAASERMHQCFLNVPSLLLFSKIDPISNDIMNHIMSSKWEKKGVRVYTKCWEKSRHVSHYYMHKEEYEGEVQAFLEAISLLKNNSKVRAAA